MLDTNNRARDHLANERTFLARIRTGVATIILGFAGIVLAGYLAWIKIAQG
jgi:uncharacterized membrane protein YidH (DUF202 family)